MIRNGDCRHLCHQFICYAGLGADHDGKKSFCMDADYVLAQTVLGPKGMFQTVADTLKLMVKEGMTPDGADKFLFNLAPFIAMIIAMLLMAPIAFCKKFPDLGY